MNFTKLKALMYFGTDTNSSYLGSKSQGGDGIKYPENSTFKVEAYTTRDLASISEFILVIISLLDMWN